MVCGSGGGRGARRCVVVVVVEVGGARCVLVCGGSWRGGFVKGGAGGGLRRSGVTNSLHARFKLGIRGSGRLGCCAAPRLCASGLRHRGAGNCDD